MDWKVLSRPSYSWLQVRLRPGEAVTAEPGAMFLIRGDVEVETGSGGLLRGLARAIAGGESFFLNTFRARGPGEVWLAPPVPGDIEYIPLKGDSYVVQDMSYLAHHGDVKVSVAWRGLRGLLAEGELFWLRLEGDGGVWVNSYGALVSLPLPPGEEVVVDNFHFVAMPSSMEWKVSKVGGLKTLFFGGEGLVMRVRGPGTLYLQTRTLPPLARLLYRLMPK